MKCEQIAELLPDYLQGSLAENETRVVAEHLSGCVSCSEEVTLWKKLALLPQEQPGPRLRSKFNEMLEAYEEGRWEKSSLAAEHTRMAPGFLGRRAWAAPAAMACGVLLLVIGFFAGRSVNSADPQRQEVARLHNELSDMRQLVVLSLLQQQSASERLQAISWSLKEDKPDPKVLGALLHTLHYDSSVNVRLAALDALSRYHSQPEVRKGLIDALQPQQSPMVQVALIDLMVEMHDSSVVSQLKRFEQDTSVNPTVRQRAEWGIKKLT